MNIPSEIAGILMFCYGVVCGSLWVCAAMSDQHWQFPRRPYAVVLASILTIGLVAYTIGMIWA